MPRTGRQFLDGLPYHILNRGNRRQTIFCQPVDYDMFLTTICDALERVPLGILAYGIMPNHFHFVVLPKSGDEISAFMRWFMNAHIRRYHRFHELWGTGHLYQGRYKAFPIEPGHHLLTVLRYVEANPLAAGLVRRAEDWKWSSLNTPTDRYGRPLLTPSPTPRPADWLDIVNKRLPTDVHDMLKTSARREIPFGDPEWIRRLGRGHSTLSVPGDCHD
jgi:putative transposase